MYYTGKKRILLVEDDTLYREAIDDYLSERYNVSAVESAEAALNFLEHEKAKPDLIILDINLPGIDGIELLRRIKTQWPGIIVVMLTAMDDISTAVTSTKLGACDYLVKSGMPEKLMTKVERILFEARR